MIFLHRKQSILPFTSDLPEGSVLDQIQSVMIAESEPEDALQRRRVVLEALGRSQRVKATGTLLSIGFETVFEYIKVRDPRTFLPLRA